MADSPTIRPAVSVVMPFAGGPDQAEQALDAISRVELASGDELIIVDNSIGQAVPSSARRWPSVRVVRAPREQSSYHARNVGAAAASNDWLLFIDADCVPHADILDRYFDDAVADHEGALAGEVFADADQATLLARYQSDRQYLSQRRHLFESRRPFAVTANVLVRKRAWQSVGGFLEGIRSGGDSEFSWRLQDAGWLIGYRPRACVSHRHRVSLRPFGRAVLRYAAGRAWLNRRYPGTYPPPASPVAMVRAVLAAGRWLLAREPERAGFRGIDALVTGLDLVGLQLPNVPRGVPPLRAGAGVLVLTDTFPELSETFVDAELCSLERAGCRTRVEAARRARRQDLDAARRHDVSYREDDLPARKIGALIWLLVRHPVGCARDLLEQQRWRREEPVPPLRVIAPTAWRLQRMGEYHLHAQFALGAALTAMRLARLSQSSFSLTAHAYDIFREPANIAEKLERAAFVATGCQYNVEYLKQVAPRAEVHEVVMGVDPQRFERSRPYPGGRVVIAVGRLVEKKGFAHLIAAAAKLAAADSLERLEIVGDGPLRDELAEQIVRLGLCDRVCLLGAIAHDEVRERLECADVLAMPCVVAADGDRDSMPVVVKEALALEMPVVGTRAVGLPELIKDDWGRLVAPGDVQGLADAIQELLALEREQRMQMGRAGRTHVLAHCNVMVEGERLAHLIRAHSTSIR